MPQSALLFAFLSGVSIATWNIFLRLGTRRPEPRDDSPPRGLLDLPLRQQNALLFAAGFAPAWRESDLSATELAQVNSALDYLLTQQEPLPAFVVDWRWRLLCANTAALGAEHQSAPA